MGWTTKQTAEYLGVTVRFVNSLIKRGKLEAKMHGRDWDVLPASARKYKEAPKDKGGRPKKSDKSRGKN